MIEIFNFDKINMEQNIIIGGRNEDVDLVLKQLNLHKKLILPLPTTYYKDYDLELQENMNSLNGLCAIHSHNNEFIDSAINSEYDFQFITVRKRDDDLYSIRVVSKEKAKTLRDDLGMEFR